ncbi:hypothetical protein LO80_05935 [Candidatus Francisella endociliophora]|uniref:Hydrolase n=1 Tax=Candidatus Francisella endociliophora TaxID=653937 RepID=A0A097EPQ3_9GAMM|nr:HAD hydrolase family protein [Francisella sp. FSC1006]AIT09548.1 hypothetical protein LO80_05935 [Francisella sp. FSC1006]
MNIIFDIDGTICDNGKHIEENIQEEIKSLYNKHNVVFASARPIRDMLPILNKEFHSSLLIGCNGGIHYKNGDFGKTHHFETNIIKQVVNFLKKGNIPYVLDGDWHYSLSKITHPFHDYIKSLSNYEYLENDLIEKGITKLLILDNTKESEVTEFLGSFNEKFNLNKHTKDSLFDITPNHNNKYIALKECGLNMQESICFGNDHNDFMMLDNAHISVFVGGENTYNDADIYTDFNGVHNVIKELKSTGVL